MSFKKPSCFNLRKKCCGEAWRFKGGSSLSLSKLEVSKIICCDPCDPSLGSLEDVSPQHKYDIVQTTVPSICSLNNKHNKKLQYFSKELSLSKNFLSKQLSTIDFYILTKSISSHNKESLWKTLNTQQKKWSSLTKNCNLPTFTANETITNLTQYELSQEESDLLKAGLYFSIQPDKIRKSEIFTTFEKIHRSFLNNLKSEETKSQIKAHLSYLANSYFYNYKFVTLLVSFVIFFHL